VTPATEPVFTAKEDTKKKAINDTKKKTGKNLRSVSIFFPPLKKLSDFLYES
jgi:hypothetical protein